MTQPDVDCGNGLWPWLSSLACGHVGPKLVWLREDGQTDRKWEYSVSNALHAGLGPSGSVPGPWFLLYQRL